MQPTPTGKMLITMHFFKISFQVRGARQNQQFSGSLNLAHCGSSPALQLGKNRRIARHPLRVAISNMLDSFVSSPLEKMIRSFSDKLDGLRPPNSEQMFDLPGTWVQSWQDGTLMESGYLRYPEVNQHSCRESLDL